ncbi:MAG: hypothetical protein KDK99_09860, partial [Verrucomicrobiales bacterium]|nr:hypothetical protein [Verrucomicrobiales bacterium]
MFSLLQNLWQTRDRPPVGSPAWWKAWVRRCQQAPALLKQAWFYARLAAGGARLEPSVFFSDAGLIEGRLDQFSAGRQSFIGRAELAVHAPLTIGSFVCINDGAKLLTASHDIRDPQWPALARPIVVEDYAWIATNAIILPGVTIGRGAVVAAGAVVSRDVPAGAVAMGNPAQIREAQRATTLDYSPVAHLAL